MLADAMGKTQGEIYDMISGGDINGQEAVNIIQAGMESMYGGAMETMAQTFDGLTSTLEDAMTEIDNAMGEGYNERAKEGLQADIDAYGGALGDALAQANEIIGEGKAIAENLDRQYSREALSALTLGTSNHRLRRGPGEPPGGDARPIYLPGGPVSKCHRGGQGGDRQPDRGAEGGGPGHG